MLHEDRSYPPNNLNNSIVILTNVAFTQAQFNVFLRAQIILLTHTPAALQINGTLMSKIHQVSEGAPNGITLY
jgi:hypothetical protein